MSPLQRTLLPLELLLRQCLHRFWSLLQSLALQRYLVPQRLSSLHLCCRRRPLMLRPRLAEVT